MQNDDLNLTMFDDYVQRMNELTNFNKVLRRENKMLLELLKENQDTIIKFQEILGNSWLKNSKRIKRLDKNTLAK